MKGSGVLPRQDPAGARNAASPSRAYLFLAAALGFAFAAVLAAGLFAGTAFAFAGAPFAGALRAAGAGLPSRSAISSMASASVMSPGRVDFEMVALTLPQLT